MKLRSASLDDILQEVQYTLDDDGGRRARLVRRIVIWSYRLHKAALLALLRLSWQRGALERKARPIPELGTEPFNLSDAELEREWGLR